MGDMFIQEFLKTFDDSRFPADFLADYDALECFSYNEAGETLLVKNRQTGKHFVAKCYTDKTLLSQITESELLKKLHHSGLPVFIGEYQNDQMLCVVREYVEGTALDQYTAENERTQDQAISITAQLCDILAYLHGQTPPVIHRDIKPQNIVVDVRGKIRLIDFGISRVYDEAAREDTVCFGTKYFAAPEQYGFSQTDGRTDIFSVGVLLCWLMTGNVDVKTAVATIENKRLRRIIEKCTAFAPDRRYVSVSKVKADLLAADGHKQKGLLRWACGLLACVACLCAGFAVGRYTDVSPAFLAARGVSFEEPLIERAVYLALDKQENVPLTEKELLSITELYICGDKAASSSEEFKAIDEHMVQNDGMVKNGGIRSLKDLAKLKNLRNIYVVLQDISDLSPLGELGVLEQIDLRHNPIEDVSALAALPALKNICLFDTRVSDLSALKSCSMLESLDIGKTYITSMTAFTGVNSLTCLSMRYTPIKTLSGIETFSRLEQISLSNVTDNDLSPLLSLPRLKQVELDEALREEAENDLKQTKFNIIYS